MEEPKVKAKSAADILALFERNLVGELIDSLSLLRSWGVRHSEYVPALGLLLHHEDPRVLKETLGIMLSYKQGPEEDSVQLRAHLPFFERIASSNCLALELIVALSGPRADLVPSLRNYLLRYPEEACDLICVFGPFAEPLVQDLIDAIDASDYDKTWAVVDALETIGPAASAAVPVLTELTRHRSGVITGRACVALESITGVSRHSWPRGPIDKV